MEILPTVKNEFTESSSMLAPGFRFHPTDEELVRYYLRRKVCGKGFRIDTISDIDIYKAEPWDLPSFSKLKTRDLEWYFFSVLDKKYGNGSKTNRATERGYWKTTGKDRDVHHKSKVIGMKKTLVYHNGRAPKGLRTNWVMHEYRLTDSDLVRAGIAQDAFVLCRVFQKSGSGPKNGERYGAPFVEEEWGDDDLSLVSKTETAEIIDFDGDGYFDVHDLEQILGANDLPHSFIEQESFDEHNSGELLLNTNDICCDQVMPINNDNFADFSPSCDTNVEKSSEPLNTLDFLLDEPFLDCNDFSFAPEFVEDDTAPRNSSDLGMIDEYLSFFDDKDGNFEFDQSSVALQSQLCDDHDTGATPESDLLNPFIKYSSKLLSSLPASPAFASELTLKDTAALRLHSLSQSSSSSHVAAGMIQIRDLTLQTNGTNQFLNKNLNIVISLGFLNGSATVESSLWINPWKIISAFFKSVFFWVFLLSISFKLGLWINAY